MDQLEAEGVSGERYRAGVGGLAGRGCAGVGGAADLLDAARVGSRNKRDSFL